MPRRRRTRSRSPCARRASRTARAGAGNARAGAAARSGAAARMRGTCSRACRLPARADEIAPARSSRRSHRARARCRGRADRPACRGDRAARGARGGSAAARRNRRPPSRGRRRARRGRNRQCAGVRRRGRHRARRRVRGDRRSARGRRSRPRPARLSGSVPDRDRRPQCKQASRIRRPRAYSRTARSAPSELRHVRGRRARGRILAAGGAQRSLAEPADAPRAGTRSAGAPTVASRFLLRLAAVAGEARWSEALARGRRYLALARTLDRAERVPIQAPAPRPPREARPNYLTVTDVEHWLRDPYTIYAKHVLRLAPLDAVNTPPGARDRGNLIHNAIGDLTQSFAEALPPNALPELLRLGGERFAPLEDFPEARAFWWPRFERIAAWFVGWDAARRAGLARSRAEIRGEITIALGDRSFRLAGRADRIDRLLGGQYVIIDYKTGEVRTEKQVRAGLAPQLTLEAAILRNGGFAEIARGASVAALVYVQLKGGEPAGEEMPIEFKEGTPDSQADHALARFTKLIARFDREDQPFRSLVHPMWKARYGDYDHLARVKEWSLAAATDANGS